MDKTSLLRSLRLCRPYAGSILAPALLVGLRVAAELAAPLMYRRIIDVAIPSGDLTAVISGAALYTLLVAGAGLLGACCSYILTCCGLDITSSLRNQLVETVLRWPLAQWDSTSTGQVQSRIISDSQTLQNLLMDTVPSLVRNFLVLPGAIATILLLDWRLSVPCLCLVPAYVLPARYWGPRNGAAWKRVADAREMFFKSVQDALQGVRLIKTTANEPDHARYLQVRERDLVDAHSAAALLGRVYGVATATISLLPVGVVLGWGGVLVARGSTSVGTVAATIAYVQQLYATVSVLPGLYMQSTQVGVFLDRVLEYFDTPTETMGSIRPDLHINCDVELSDVYLVHGERVALANASLTIRTGQTVAIIGPSGSGKSSVAALILGMYKPLRGDVSVGGVTIGRCDTAWLRRQIGVVGQDTFLFNGSIYDNIAYSKADATIDDVVRAAKLACIHDFISSLPLGYGTPCGERGVQLSGGQRQRIAIARALIRDPELLILDEATSGLDRETEAELILTLSDLKRSRTTIVVSHRSSMLSIADYVYVMAEGQVVVEGTPTEVDLRGVV